MARTDNAIVIDAPLDVTWEMTNDVESWPDLFTEYAKAEILEREGDTITFRLTMHPDEQGNEWSWVSQRTTDPQTRTVKAHRIETGWFDHMNIEWSYREVDGGTEMRWVQEFTMKSDSPFDDQQMTDRLNQNTAVQMQVIKERVEARAASSSASA
jgi:aromatase